MITPRSKPQVVHFFENSIFNSGFIALAETDLRKDIDQFYVVWGGLPTKYYPPVSGRNVLYSQQDFFFSLKALWWTLRADHVVIHGLYNRRLLVLLICLFTSTTVTWVIWGGDLPSNSEKSFKGRLKSRLVRWLAPRVDQIVTLDQSDKLRFLSFRGSAEVRSFPGRYPNPISLALIAKAKQTSRQKKKSRVLIGNSATASNQHLEVFEGLKHLVCPDVEFIVPLGYGDPAYRDEVLAGGKRLLGVSFLPLTEQLSISEYIAILADLDAAIFYMPRQQALSNIFGLIAMGCKVYLHPHSGVIRTLKHDYDIDLWSFDDFLTGDRSLQRLIAADPATIAANKKKIEQVYDHPTMVAYWNDILNPVGLTRRTQSAERRELETY